MPSIFDEFDRTHSPDSEPESGAGVANVVRELDDEDIDEEMLEAQRKLQKAEFYRVIVSNGVVEDNGTKEATEVNAEAKVWARRSMLKLLRGENPLDPPPPPPAKIEPQFTDEEALVLRQLVRKAVEVGMVPKPTGSTATVKKVEAPRPAAPSVRKVKTRPSPAQPTPVSQKPSSQPSKAKPLKVQAAADGTLDYDSIPTGEIFKDPANNRLYKMVDNTNYNPDIPGSKPRSKISVNNQVRSPGSIPMPSAAQMQAISATQAMEAINLGASVSSEIAPGTEAGGGHFVAAAASALRND